MRDSTHPIKVIWPAAQKSAAAEGQTWTWVFPAITSQTQSSTCVTSKLHNRTACILQNVRLMDFPMSTMVFSAY